MPLALSPRRAIFSHSKQCQVHPFTISTDSQSWHTPAFKPPTMMNLNLAILSLFLLLVPNMGQVASLDAGTSIEAPDSPILSTNDDGILCLSFDEVMDLVDAVEAGQTQTLKRSGPSLPGDRRQLAPVTVSVLEKDNVLVDGDKYCFYNLRTSQYECAEPDNDDQCGPTVSASWCYCCTGRGC